MARFVLQAAPRRRALSCFLPNLVLQHPSWRSSSLRAEKRIPGVPCWNPVPGVAHSAAPIRSGASKSGLFSGNAFSCRMLGSLPQRDLETDASREVYPAGKICEENGGSRKPPDVESKKEAIRESADGYTLAIQSSGKATSMYAATARRHDVKKRTTKAVQNDPQRDSFNNELQSSGLNSPKAMEMDTAKKPNGKTTNSSRHGHKNTNTTTPRTNVEIKTDTRHDLETDTHETDGSSKVSKDRTRKPSVKRKNVVKDDSGSEIRSPEEIIWKGTTNANRPSLETENDLETDIHTIRSSRKASNNRAKKTGARMKNVVKDDFGRDVHEIQSTDEGISRDTNSTSRPSLETENDASILNARSSMAVEESIEALEVLLRKLDASVPTDVLQIGATCLRLAQLCVSMDEDADKILMYGQRALGIFGCNQTSVEYATCLETIGCAYHKKGEFEKAVRQLERSAMILERLSITMTEKELGSLKYAVQALLGQANMELGREEEALLNFQEALAINERVLESHDPSLGKSYQKTAEVCIQAQDFNEALALCMKALPIYIEHYGESSLQVAELRKLLSVIYYELDEFDKVLCEHEVIRPIIERLGKPTELASLDLAAGEALLCLERYKKAIPKLNNAAKHALPGSCIHGQALVLLSKAYASLKQDKIASRYCKKALDVLKENAKSAVTGASLVELASVLQSLQEHEKSMAVLEIALQAYQQQPVEQAAAAYIECQIGRSYLSLNKFGEASAYLERSSAKIETLHGPESPELLDVYNHLGIAYMRLERLDAAIAKFEAAQAILKLSDVTDSEVTITLYNNLACLYDMVGRVGDSLICQKCLIDSIKKSGIENIVPLETAEQKLESLIQKVKASESTGRKE